MPKRMITLLGIGLVVLWVAGLGSLNATKWLTWMDGVAALFSFGIAAFTPAYAHKTARVGLPLAVSVGLFALWVVGLATNATTWLCWWTFAFACAFLGVGIACASERRPPLVETIMSDSLREHERERPRKSA